MARVQLLGPRDLLPSALAFLQAQGALELRAPTAAAGGSAPLVSPAACGADVAALEARLAEAVRRLDALAARLPEAPGAPLAPVELPEPGSPALLARVAELEARVGSLESRRAALVEEREATAWFSRLVVSLAPLHHRLHPDLQPEIHGLVLRTDPEALALLRAEVERMTAACEVVARPLDAESTGVLVVVPRVHGRELTALLVGRGVDEVRLPAAYTGKPIVDVLLLLARRERAIPAELTAVEAELASVAAVRPALEASARAARAALDRLDARGRCGETRFAFVVSGYTPEERVAALREDAAAQLGQRVTVLAHRPERRDWPEVPVVLRNRPALRPFERLLAFVPLPRYGSVDPTPWLAVFFPLFFGLVLGDVVLGVVGVAAALVARRRGWGGATGRDLAWIALWCSISAVAFGLVFGEALGELGAHAGLHPLLLDRRRAFMGLLAFSLAVGGVHVAVGIALGIAAALRAGRRREAVGRTAKLLLLVAAGAAALAFAGILPRRAVPAAVLSGIAFLAVAVAVEGPMAALELVLVLGNVLSYSRLMALGLASVMLAEVANLLATTLEPAAAGIAVAVLLHAVNFTLGLISPTIAALRLHYVEFFEKFYDEGGAPWRPFALTA